MTTTPERPRRRSSRELAADPSSWLVLTEAEARRVEDALALIDQALAVIDADPDPEARVKTRAVLAWTQRDSGTGDVPYAVLTSDSATGSPVHRETHAARLQRRQDEDVYALAQRGYSRGQIAALLGVAPNAVDVRLDRVRRRLGASLAGLPLSARSRNALVLHGVTSEQALRALTDAALADIQQGLGPQGRREIQRTLARLRRQSARRRRTGMGGGGDVD